MSAQHFWLALLLGLLLEILCVKGTMVRWYLLLFLFKIYIWAEIRRTWYQEHHDSFCHTHFVKILWMKSIFLCYAQQQSHDYGHILHIPFPHLDCTLLHWGYFQEDICTAANIAEYTSDPLCRAFVCLCDSIIQYMHHRSQQLQSFSGKLVSSF